MTTAKKSITFHKFTGTCDDATVRSVLVNEYKVPEDQVRMLRINKVFQSPEQILQKKVNAVFDSEATVNWLMSHRHIKMRPQMRTKEERETEMQRRRGLSQEEYDEEVKKERQAGKMCINIPKAVYDPWFLKLMRINDYIFRQCNEATRPPYLRIKYVDLELVLEARIPGMKIDQTMMISMYDESSPEAIFKELQKRASGLKG